MCCDQPTHMFSIEKAVGSHVVRIKCVLESVGCRDIIAVLNGRSHKHCCCCCKKKKSYRYCHSLLSSGLLGSVIKKNYKDTIGV
ncbi:hypothetical protein AB205_0059950 [Aquarana catesbeiana]|uniref:Uncharacterized protein n=1 Tax=Aquarana catesbeiana TaxID=8400 RepID=A0A2G9PU72_AQUCT|nr:hypothetical protein AB205_0059950 [Aquarana catesbeiana]